MAFIIMFILKLIPGGFEVLGLALCILLAYPYIVAGLTIRGCVYNRVFALAFAGGTMLYVISDEMIPETHAHGSERGATYSLLAGFCLMLAFDFLLG